MALELFKYKYSYKYSCSTLHNCHQFQFRKVNLMPIIHGHRAECSSSRKQNGLLTMRKKYITSIAPWDFLILLLISFKGARSMLHGHHTWHRAGPFHGSACSTQFLSQMFCVPGPPRNFQISKARHALSRWFAYKECPNLTEGQRLGTHRQQAVESKNAVYF